MRFKAHTCSVSHDCTHYFYKCTDTTTIQMTVNHSFFTLS